MWDLFGNVSSRCDEQNTRSIEKRCNEKVLREVSLLGDAELSLSSFDGDSAISGFPLFSQGRCGDHLGISLLWTVSHLPRGVHYG